MEVGLANCHLPSSHLAYIDFGLTAGEVDSDQGLSGQLALFFLFSNVASEEKTMNGGGNAFLCLGNWIILIGPALIQLLSFVELQYSCPQKNRNETYTMAKKKATELPNRDKGSYRHVLDLVSASNFREIVDGLLKKSGACLAEPDCRHPCGRLKKKDWTETTVEDYLERYPLPEYVGLNRTWWIPFKGNRPTWDLICHIVIDKKPGLLIVEAKAHHNEMTEKNSKSTVDKKNDRSIANDLSIRLRLSEASLALNRIKSCELGLSADHDYQLSNRLAYLHKLASDGVPTILMYLGWTISPDWTTDPFTNDSDWNASVKKHFERIGPWELVEKKHRLDLGASFQMIVRSLCPSVLANS